MYRKTFAEVDLGAIQYNLKSIRAHIPKESGVIAVVKADAYGHGAAAVGKAALKAGASVLAVELAEEAIPLREARVDCPIVVLGGANSAQRALAVELDISQCVCGAEEIRHFQDLAGAAGRKARVHIKIDTGMGRIGLTGEAALREALLAMDECPDVEPEGVFTHFSRADEPDDSFTEEQMRRFRQYLDTFRRVRRAPYIHAANSAAAIRRPKELSCDYIRYGIALYGYYPSRHVERSIDLKPAMRVLAEISHIKEVEPGTLIGYGGTYAAKGKERIATVQIGYADGYPRLMSGRGRMIVSAADGPRYAPVTGRVCMDQTMINVTGIKGVNKGDLVTVLGRVGGKSVDADEIAGLCGTISYEILCGISKRVPRVYIGE